MGLPDSLEEEYEVAELTEKELAERERMLVLKAYDDLDNYYRLSSLAVDDFSDDAAKRAYRALRQAFRETEEPGMQSSFLILSTSQDRLDREAQRTMLDYFISCQFHVVSTTEYQGLIKVVKLKALRKRIRDACRHMFAVCKQNFNASQLHQIFTEKFEWAFGGYTDKKLLHPEVDILRNYGEHLAKLQSTEGQAQRKAPTGFPSLTRMMRGGLAPGQVIGVLARSGMGKSVFGLQFGRNLAKSAKTALFSFEMQCHEISARIMTQELQRPTEMIKPEEVYSIAELRARNLWVDDQQYSLRTFRRQIKLIKLAHPDLRFVVIDYAQQLGPKDAGPQSEVSAGLKAMAMEENLGVVALLQATTEMDQRKDTRPRSSDVRWCKTYEQDVDMMLGLWRPGYYDEKVDPATAFLLMLKHRDGPKGEIEISWNPATITFREMTAPGPRATSQELFDAVHAVPDMF